MAYADDETFRKILELEESDEECEMADVTSLQKVYTDDGVGIAYRSFGDGPCTLLLMHGWGGAGSGHSWNEVLRYLNLSGLRLLVVDLRGHGHSDRSENGFTLSHFASDMLTVANHAGVQKFVAVGYSMSGRWAQWMSYHMPERIEGQILIAPAPAKALALTDDILERWMQDVQERSTFEHFAAQFTKEPLPAQIVDAYFQDASQCWPRALRQTFNMCRTEDFSSNLADTSVPTLVVAGRYDPMFSPEFLREEIVAHIPQARMVVLQCGHEIPLEKPLQLAGLVEAFAAGLATST